MATTPKVLFLASASSARAALLCAAGVEFVVEPAAIDERAKKRRFREAADGPRDCALALA